MYLSEVFEQLFFGELSQTAIGKHVADPTQMDPIHYPKMINYINLGVLELHKKFELLESEVVIQQYTGLTDYYLKYDFAITNPAVPGEPIRYIVDSVDEPFTTNRPLRVLSLTNEAGQEYTLNPSFTVPSLELTPTLIAYTPSQLHLQIPYPNDANAVFAICQAAPNNIPTNNTTPTTTEVEIPDILLGPLLIFIAERYFIVMAGDKEENRIYPSKFDKACKDIDKNNLINKSQIQGNNRFWMNGWV